MALLHYIDNEVPSFAEWDAVITTGGSSILRTAAASFPERGNIGLRTTTTVGNVAYVQKDDFCDTPAPGEAIVTGFWFNLQATPADYTQIMSHMIGTCDTLLFCFSTPSLKIRARDDAGTKHYVGNHTIVTGRWYYITVLVRRATTNIAADGQAILYVDGVEVAAKTDIDNYDRMNSVGDYFRAGCVANPRDDFIGDFDEFKIATTLPGVEPCRPTPATDYVEAANTLVLYREASADSREFADYCVSQLGIPLANLVPLPNASGNETLADYATFQAEIETDLAAWLAVNPVADANKICFMVGYNLPGYFYDGGIKVSTTSRLMRYGTAFSNGTTNPLYLGTTGPDGQAVPPVRLTKTALDAAGITLSTRIDAPSLATAKSLLDAGLAVSVLDTLTDIDVFYSSDTDYIASLLCQKLRLITSSNLTYIDNAAVFYGTGSGSLLDTGSRATFVGTGWSSADSLRELSNSVYSALRYHGWASAIGWGSSPDTFDADSFFEMLRIGGTFAEAAAIAIGRLDYSAVMAGLPWMTVSFPKQGHNIYKGTGGVESVDFSAPVACLRHDQDQATLKTTLAAGQRHLYAARAVSTTGIEEKNTIITTFIEVDEQGETLSPPLSRPFELSATAQTDGSLLVSFSHEVNDGESEPTSFELLSDFGTGEINLNSPVGILPDLSTEQREFEMPAVSATLPAMFAARSMRDEQTSPLSETVFVQSWPSPQPPTLF